MLNLKDAIKAANLADDAFAAALRDAGFKSRWDWDYRQPGLFVALRHAYRNKVEADSVMHAAFEADRLHAAGRTKAGNDISGI